MFDVVAEKAKKWLPNYSNWMHVKRKYDHSNPKIVMCNVDFSTICDLIQHIKSIDFTYVLEKVSITLFKGKYNSTNRNIFVCGDQYCFESVESIKDAIKLTMKLFNILSVLIPILGFGQMMENEKAPYLVTILFLIKVYLLR